MPNRVCCQFLHQVNNKGVRDGGINKFGIIKAEYNLGVRTTQNKKLKFRKVMDSFA